MAINNKNALILSALILMSGLLVSYTLIAHALSRSDITFPVQSLGNCASEAECRAYCNLPENSSACLAFAREYNLVPQDQLAQWQKFSDVAANGGPGGCKSEKECINYCQDSSHIVECTDFVAKYNLVSADELAQMQKIAAAVKQGAKLPGGCNGKDACETYCQDPAHIDECLAFAEKAQLLSPQDLAEAKQVAPYLKSGQTPGGCKSKSECETYCHDAAHTQECVSFAEKAGFMTKEEGDVALKIGGRGPGGCHSQDECESFCSNPANQQICIDFAKQNGLISPEESNYLDRFKDFSTCLEITTPEVKACIVDALGQENVDKITKGILPMDLSLLDKFRQAHACVAKSSQGDLNNLPPEMQSCLSGKLGPGVLQEVGTNNVSCKDVAPLQKAINECIAEGKGGGSAEVDQCLTMDCSRALECFNRLSEKAQKSINQKPDPRIQAKLDACTSDAINTCVAKPCAEFFTCISGLQKGGGGGQQGPSNPALDAKIQSCTKQQQQNQQQLPSGQPQTQQPPSGSQQVDCSAFASVPSCSYITDSQGNSLCKQCFPNK